MKNNIMTRVIGNVVAVPLVVKGVIEGTIEGLSIDFNTPRLEGTELWFGEVVES